MSETLTNNHHRFSIAPMLDWTDKYCRYFHRLLTQQTLLYTEMVTTGALLHGDVPRHLDFFKEEHPVALQLGGSEPADLAACAKLGVEWGYDEINLNVGCPSDRVQSGRFGACLMAEPSLVAEGVNAMSEAVDIPVTVKHRIGIDDQDSYEELTQFVGTVAAAGCDTFIVHARKAWLQGLSPKQNRDVPPLNYKTVYQLKQDFPALEFVINGGIKTQSEIDAHLAQIDGVMVGREVYHNPWLLAGIDEQVFGLPASGLTRHNVVRQLLPFIEEQRQKDIYLNHISRHILGLFHAQPGARAWRRYISENAHKKGAGPEVIEAALALLPEPALESV